MLGNSWVRNLRLRWLVEPAALPAQTLFWSAESTQGRLRLSLRKSVAAQCKPKEKPAVWRDDLGRHRARKPLPAAAT